MSIRKDLIDDVVASKELLRVALCMKDRHLSIGLLEALKDAFGNLHELVSDSDFDASTVRAVINKYEKTKHKT